MPMVPEAAIAMLACARLGAIHSVVFGGFAAANSRRASTTPNPKVIVSASCGMEPGRVVKYKPLLDAAIACRAHKPDACLILQRPQARGDADRRPRPRLARGGSAPPRRTTACRSPPPIRCTFFTPPEPPAGPRASCATTAATRWRCGSMNNDLRHRARRRLLGRLRRRLGRRPQLHRLRAAAARLHHASCTRASRSARPTPARSGG